MRRVTTGCGGGDTQTGVLHRRSSSAFTSSGNAALRSGTGGEKGCRGEKTPPAASPAPARASAAPALRKQTNSRAVAIFPLGRGQLISRRGVCV